MESVTSCSIITWLHPGQGATFSKDTAGVDESRPLTGVFYTRSPARPKPARADR